MTKKSKIWLCVKACDVELSVTGEHLHYFEGEFVESEIDPFPTCFLCVTTEQHRQLRTILRSIAKEKAYQEKQNLIIFNSHPRGNWKASQRLTGSLQEARSMRARFNKLVSEIAGKEIEVFWDCKTKHQTAW